MDIILLDRIRKLGDLGDKVNVSPGYARNFLIPKGKAVPATRDNITLFEERRAELQDKANSSLVAARARLAGLEALRQVIIAAKAGDEGKLFGSVGQRDIAQAIVAAGVEISKHEVKLPNGSLRTIGEHEVHCQFHSEVQGKLIVSIVSINS